MAKDKAKELEYKAEGRRRAYIRLNARTELWRKRGEIGVNPKHPYKECEECGGYMSWCSTCNMWTRTCCEEYGTCACS